MFRKKMDPAYIYMAPTEYGSDYQIRDIWMMWIEEIAARWEGEAKG